MDNDFNTAQALAHLFDAVKLLNKILRTLPAQPASADSQLLHDTATVFRNLAGVLGLVQRNPAEVAAGAKAKAMDGVDLGEDEINGLIVKRNQARGAKDWATSDEVRDYLLAHRIVLKDGPEGTTWEVKK
jgi:cysteinyl-tRNA synthetase